MSLTLVLEYETSTLHCSYERVVTKDGRRSSPGLLAARSHAGGDAHQVLLGNADLNGLLGILIEERRERRGAAGVGAQDDDVLIGLGGLEQRVADTLRLAILLAIDGLLMGSEIGDDLAYSSSLGR